MVGFRICVLFFMTSLCISSLAMEEKIQEEAKAKAQEIAQREGLAAPYSKLCELFGINPALLVLPEDAQICSVKKIKELYPFAFKEWEASKPFAELKLHSDDLPRWWNGKQGSQVRTGITDLVLMPKSGNLISCSANRHIAIWDVSSLQLIKELKVHEPVTQEDITSVNKSRCKLAVTDDESLLAISIEDKVHIFDLKTFEKKCVLPVGFEAGVLAFLKNSSQLFVGPHYDSLVLPEKKYASSLHLWDALRQTCTFQHNLKSRICEIALSNDRTRVAVVRRYEAPFIDEREFKKSTCISVYCMSQNAIGLLHECGVNDGGSQKVAFLDNEHILLKEYHRLILINASDSLPVQGSSVFEGPFIKARFNNIRKQINQIDQEWQNSTFLGIDETASWPVHMYYDPIKRWLFLVHWNHATKVYDLKTGDNVVTFFKRPRPARNDHGDVKCVFSPEHGRCFTIFTMQAHDIFSPLLVWQAPPSSIIKGTLTIQQALFVVLMHILRRAITDVRLISFDPDLRNEFASILSRPSLSEMQLIFLRHASFSNCLFMKPKPVAVSVPQPQTFQLLKCIEHRN